MLKTKTKGLKNKSHYGHSDRTPTEMTKHELKQPEEEIVQHPLKDFMFKNFDDLHQKAAREELENREI